MMYPLGHPPYRPLHYRIAIMRQSYDVSLKVIARAMAFNIRIDDPLMKRAIDAGLIELIPVLTARGRELADEEDEYEDTHPCQPAHHQAE